MKISNETFQSNLYEIIAEMNGDRLGYLEECENPLGIIKLPNGEDVKVSIKVSRDLDD